MKIRNGFVSNSSTSSYVIVCKKDINDKAVKKLHPYFQEWLKQRTYMEEQKFDGKDVVVVSGHYCSEDDSPLDYSGSYPKNAQEWDGSGDEEGPIAKFIPTDEVMGIYIEALKKIDSEIIVVRGD
jgi:hypothetical protein